MLVCLFVCRVVYYAISVAQYCGGLCPYKHIISNFSPHLFLHIYYSQSAFNRILGNFIASKTIPQGAATTVYACVAPGIGTDAVSVVKFSVAVCMHSISLDIFMHQLYSHFTNTHVKYTYIIPLPLQNRGAYLEDCRLSQPTVEDGVDANGTLREALWKATEEQLAAAVEKANLQISVQCGRYVVVLWGGWCGQGVVVNVWCQQVVVWQECSMKDKRARVYDNIWCIVISLCNQVLSK